MKQTGEERHELLIEPKAGRRQASCLYSTCADTKVVSQEISVIHCHTSKGLSVQYTLLCCYNNMTLPHSCGMCMYYLFVSQAAKRNSFMPVLKMKSSILLGFTSLRGQTCVATEVHGQTRKGLAVSQRHSDRATGGCGHALAEGGVNRKTPSCHC